MERHKGVQQRGKGVAKANTKALIGNITGWYANYSIDHGFIMWYGVAPPPPPFVACVPLISGIL